MIENPGGNALLQVSAVELVRHACSLVRKAAEQLEPVSPDLVRWRGRTSRILFVADPRGAPASLICQLVDGRGICVDFVTRYNQCDPDNVFERLAAFKYDLLIPSNIELSPWYIPALVSSVRQRHPALKILVISGWSSPEFVHDLTTRGIDDFVRLPGQAEEIQERILRLMPGYYDQGGNC
jgi:DNA-binding NarL/FixJ family response regulator